MSLVKTLAKQTVTINQVAKMAGVSTATVSRALNKPDTVSEAVKKKIERIIKRIGYIPNAGARSLMLKRTGSIGVIVPTLDNAIFAQGLEEFQRQLSQSGYQMLVASTNYDPEIENQQMRNLLLQGVEGIAMFGSSQKLELIRLLRTRKLPYIHIGTLDTPLNGYAAGFDNKKAIQLGVEYLVQVGHRNFGMIAGKTENNDRARDRVDGVVELLKRHRIVLKKESIIEVPYQIQDARIALKKLLQINPKISAVVCGNDVLAIGALLEAQSQGIKIPYQCSILGFDNLELSRHIQPSLSTIHIDAIGMWSKAAHHLMSQINGINRLPRKILADVSLVIRDSTGGVLKT
ncbi:MAG: LacI family DNA-binding transcriptional regulator [Akkermansiaceae bacterium]|nr:LacI family DNA-binding transcriptional regulator [Akkermansiaceae bacterium]